MKFSSSLKFNAVSDWWDEYIASYDSLKKSIYQLEKRQHGPEHLITPDLEANEQSSLLGEAEATNTDTLFIPLLDHELRKIVLFYGHQEKELLDDLKDLEGDVTLQDEMGLDGGGHYADYDDREIDDDESFSASRSPERVRARKSSSAGRNRGAHSLEPSTSQQRRLSVSSVESNPELGDSYLGASYSQAHGSKGPFGKLSNKFHTLKDSLTSNVEPTTIWTAKSNYAYDTRLLFKRRITNLYISFTNLKAYVEINYAGFRKIIKKYDKVTFSELKDRYLHEVVEVAPPFTQASKDKLNDAINRLIDLYTKCVARGDPNVARQQLRLHQRENIAWERDTVWRQMIGRERRGEGEHEDMLGASLIHEPEPAIVDIPTPVGQFKITRRKILRVLSIVLLFVMLKIPFIEEEQANRCFAILTFCTFLWATEAIPLFVTSMFVPFLLVLLNVLRDSDGVPLEKKAATGFIFSVMFSPTIMLLIGGFTISSALSKTNIDRVLITKVLSLAGTRPRTPILRTLPPKSAFGPCLILAIALAANIGGQSSPISSPQNLIALQYMDPKLDWATWFAVALPVSALSIVLIWLFLLVSYHPERSPDGEGVIEIKAIRPTKEKFTVKQYWVTFVCLFTIALWCIEHEIEPYVGDMGVIALIPVLAFFSTNVLKKASGYEKKHSLLADDFEHFMWSIVFLAMGGIALGKGVMSSGLLDVMDSRIKDLVSGLSLGHTIASVLLVPIAKEVASNLPGQPKNLLIFITALICSAGMGMPVSGFPNQTAATQEDELGEPYLTNVDFLKNGVPASIIATVVISTVGFLLMKIVGV
ncbi:hypothetical protein CVT24_011055 [Panaeolus cyanescens]|uniref:SPX domain-containing protein n=1 Tax=Panaeolus cyanescens TaxID=181874 RepID=A0A409VFY7_9AGAR|nr:hypothetical protein CVT24_011055 [Panaeolus cyanescens]